MPPTEKRGRVHTSSVTVAVINPGSFQARPEFLRRSETDFRVEWFSGTGKGGQKRNKSQSCARVIHIPSGLSETRQGRSRESNFHEAKEALLQTLERKASGQVDFELMSTRKDQMGSGMRGDKRRTYRSQDNQVHDHVTGKRSTWDRVLRGAFEELWVS